MKKKSKCCNAEIDYRGGGYDGEDICPIIDYCTECDQTLEINGMEQDIIINPKRQRKLAKDKGYKLGK